tara:strand:- start:51 stop:452 length:402 start_codon:yes stop_codon:yes gene_type:complete
MASKGNWTIVFEDKIIIKNCAEGANEGIGYKIDDDSFWNDSKWSNIWAIQYIDDNHDYNDSVEYRDETPHATWTSANLGNFQTQFIDKWDAAHLAKLQSDWDDDNIVDENGDSTESESQKIARLGARPTSYSS